MGLIDLSGAEVIRRMTAGEVSCVDVMTAALDRIDAVNGPLNAIVSMRDPASLIAEAEAADRARTAGEAVGPLFGLPIAVKDAANAAGLETSKGSPILAGQIAKSDDLAIGRMRAAGAIFIGKTNIPEFGLGSHTFNPVHGASINPYGPGRTPGGSSGGAAAALAARMQWLCDGSDMMGSLRNPAGWNNVYGFRPSWGRVPPDPGGDVIMHPLTTLGPMARDVTDIALLLDVMAGPAPRVPFAPRAEAYSGRINADVTGRRVAWAADWGGAWPMERGILDTCETALDRFRDIGIEVERIDPPFPAEELWDSWVTLRQLAVAGRIGPVYARPDLRAKLRDVAIWETEAGLALSAEQILRASAIRSRWHSAAADLFTRFDAVILPTAQCWPFPVETPYPTEIGGVAMDTYHRWMECVIPASLGGFPSLGAPAGFGADGLPIGLQIIGRYGDDLGVLQIGQAWHEATRWPQERPPML
ncbi:MAG: amidase [Pseudooceanicola sp.]